MEQVRFKDQLEAIEHKELKDPGMQGSMELIGFKDQLGSIEHIESKDHQACTHHGTGKIQGTVRIRPSRINGTDRIQGSDRIN